MCGFGALQLLFLAVAAAAPATPSPAPVLEPALYTSVVTLHEFQPRKMICKPGDTAEFDFAYTALPNHEGEGVPTLTAELWIERGVDVPFRAARETVPAPRGKRQTATLTWTCDADLFGHRAWLRIRDSRDRVLAERDTLFDVCRDWIHVMRLASDGAWKKANPDITDAQVEEQIRLLRENCLNAFEMWTFSPKPYVLAPAEATWEYQYAKAGVKPVSRERLQAWGAALHRNGMKYVAYNETSAATGPADWQVFLPEVSKTKPFAHYFENEGMFTPNALKIAPLFADQLEQSIKTFGWDGILMDSAIACYISTSRGTDRDGKPLTDLSAGEVGYRYLEAARRQALAANPEFRFLSQNATSVSHKGVREPADKMYPWIAENAKRLQIQRYSEAVDLYTLEIDAHNEPRDGRYPLTYETMSLALNSIVESTGRPLMAWASLVPPHGREYDPAFVRPYMALHLASRTHVHDHFTYYGGVMSDGRNSPAARQAALYNRFQARFSYYLFDPELRWLVAPGERIKVESSAPLFWQRTVYRRALADRKERIILHLLNLPATGQMLGRTDVPPPAQNVTVTITAGRPGRVVWVSADDPALTPLELVACGDRTYRVPPVVGWGFVVVEGEAP